MPYLVLDPAAAEAAPSTTLGEPLTGTAGETLGSMRTELAAQFAGRTDVPEARLNKWINYAYADFASSVDIEAFEGSLAFTLVPGQPLYLLPPVVSYIRMVSVIDTVNYGERGGRPLEKWDKPKYRRSRDFTSEPYAFFREGQLLVVYPTPVVERVIVADFKLQPIWLADDAEQPIGGQEWHEGLITFARSKGFRALLQWDKAAVEKNEWTDFVRRKLDKRSGEDEGRIVTSSYPRNRRELTAQPLSAELFDDAL